MSNNIDYFSDWGDIDLSGYRVKEEEEFEVLEGEKIRMVAFYGKAGIGKSTTACNVSASLSLDGETVMQVGCDPKRDSISMLCGGVLKQTILQEMLRRNEVTVSEDLIHEVVHRGFNDIACIESGGPKPGIGCAGRGVNYALTMLDRFEIFAKYKVTFVLFDVLGDTVCGGFAQPIRSGFAQEMYIVTCGEPLTLLQTSNMGAGVRNMVARGYQCVVGGLINNQRGVPNEEKIVDEFAKLMGVPVIQHIPRSRLVQDAELTGKCVVEAFPNSEQAECYRTLARKIFANVDTYIPKEVSLAEIKEIVGKYS